jgi:glycosyltransferase involved in cell wall biosynthesis
MHKSYAAAVFAHNEEKNLIACLESIDGSELANDLDVFVLANGCTDGTEELVRRYARLHDNVHLVEIQKGDKANAWNFFVHECIPNADTYFFIDGDVRVDQGALKLLSIALNNNPSAHIASAVPGSGRSREIQTRELIETSGVHGNLYAIRGSFLNEIRKRNVRLPIGFVREDGLIGALAKWDLAPNKDSWNQERIVPVIEARFLFNSMHVLNVHDIFKYLKRRFRYSIGHFETAMLRIQLKRFGLPGIPTDVEELYSMVEVPRLQWRGLNTLFDWAAIRKIKQLKKPASEL